MDKYLQQILDEVNTIIIPGLGALTITNKSTGEIMFMGFLKHDDGNLARYISEKEGLSENDAKNMIAKYVREIQAKLDTGDSYDMYRFGRFVKKNGEIEFESAGASDGSEAAPKPTPVSEPEKETPIVSMNPVASPEPDTAPEAVATPEPEPVAPIEEPKPVVESDTVLPPMQEKAPEEKPEAPLNTTEIKPDENVYIPEQEVAELKKQQAETPQAPTSKTPDNKTKPEVKKPVKTKAEKAPKPPKQKSDKKRSPMFWVWIILGILLLGGGATTAIFFKEVKAMITGEHADPSKPNADSLAMAEADQKEQEAAAEQEAQLESAASNEEMPPPTETMEETPEVEKQVMPDPVASSDPGNPYHVIAGGFANEGNATRFAEKLKGEGKAASVLGKFDDLYLVSAGAYGSRQEAASAMQSGGVSGWVFKYPK